MYLANKTIATIALCSFQAHEPTKMCHAKKNFQARTQISRSYSAHTARDASETKKSSSLSLQLTWLPMNNQIYAIQ
jgi:hypothetical protein